MDEAPREDVAAIAKRDATNEDPERIFYGWAVVSCECAQTDCIVRASPIEDPPNPYHADIVFPDKVKDDKDYRTACAHHLAENAKWLEWQEREKSQREHPPKLRVI